MDDATIINLFWARDEAAIPAAQDKYGAYCRAIALGILADARDADECVNDALLRLWRAIPPERPERLPAYVCRIVRNAALSRRRRDGAQKRGGNYTVALSELEGCIAAPEDSQSALDAKELTAALERFLDTLSEENRGIFLRRYWFADKCADIGRRVGLSEKAVTVRLTRLRKQLKKYLAEQEVYV